MKQGDELPTPGMQRIRIENELAAIEASPAFVRSPVMRRLLRFIVAESEAGRGALIKSYTVAVDGLGRGEDFDAQQDSYPRVQIGRLRKALETYYRQHSSAAGLRFELRSGSYEIHFVETGAAVGRSSFGLTPSLWTKIRRNLGAMPYQAGAWGLPIALLLAAGIFVTTDAGQRWFSPWLLENAPVSDAGQDLPILEIQSVAVTENADTEIGEVLTFQITDAIRKSGWVRLRTATPVPARSIPGGAPDYQLRSRLYKQGNDLTWAVELVEARNDLVLWTRDIPLRREVDGHVADLSPILALVTDTVVEPGGIIAERALQKYAHVPPPPGYLCMIRAAGFRANRHAAEFSDLDSCLSRTLAAQPRLARAKSLMAVMKQENLDFGYVSRKEDTSASIVQMAESAADLDPTDALVLSNLAYLQYRQGDYPRASSNAWKAQALNGYSANLLRRMGTFLFFMGDNRGLDLVQRWAKIDPNSAMQFSAARFFGAVAAGQTADAVGEAAKLQDTQDDSRVYVAAIRAVAAAMQNRPGVAKQYWQEVTRRVPDMTGDLAYIFRRMGISAPFAERSATVLRHAGVA